MKNFMDITEIDLYTDITDFSQAEILYLWNHFMEATGGKKEMNYPKYIRVIENDNNNKLNQGDIFFAKALFSLFDDRDTGSLIFENYVVICNAISREHIEKKFEILFFLIKGSDPEVNTIEIEDTRKKIELLSQNMPKSKLETRSLSMIHDNTTKKKINLAQNFSQSMFYNTKILRLKDFVKNALTSVSAYLLLEKVDSLIIPLCFDMDKRLKNKIYKMPLHYIITVERTNIPNAIFLLCQTVKRKINEFDYFNPEKDIKSLSKGEINLVEALVHSFDLGYANIVELNEISVSILIFTLRTVLEFMSAPLLTFTLSKVVNKKKFWLNDKDKNMMLVLKTIPISFLDTLFCVVDTLCLITKNSRPSLERMSILFSTSFVRLEDGEAHYGPKVVTYLIKHFVQLNKSMKVKKITLVNDTTIESGLSIGGTILESYEAEIDKKHNLLTKFKDTSSTSMSNLLRKNK
eukprot:TRINITY_DN6909_c0_g2_i1.p1 TRINITY_DN6909_c0_g2~~TRINITY_DN6909_c0_g2_i1.p1  ORF type:complete len:463 (+),score=118.54 TRINITY_DN6909_c0_g2_i1:85-1473(+)